jgi:hypothetical protein
MIIEGENFSDENNVTTSLGYYRRIPSQNGKKIEIKIPELQIPNFSGKEIELPSYFFIVNENGRVMYDNVVYKIK